MSMMDEMVVPVRPMSTIDANNFGESFLADRREQEAAEAERRSSPEVVTDLAARALEMLSGRRHVAAT